MIGFALTVAGLTLVVGLVGAFVVRLLPTLSLQLGGLVLLALVLPLASVALCGAMMFESGEDRVVLGIAVTSALAVGVGAFMVRAGLVRRVERLESAARALAGGDLSARAPGGGPGELARVSAAFNEMADRIEELFDARRQLVAGASHDLRTPLASLQAMIEAITDGVAPAERYLPAMRERVHALGGLVDDLFELARIDAGALTVELRAARVESLVQACLRGVEAEARARSVSLTSRVAEALPPALCAPESVERVLLNLLTNALRHTPSDGTVAVQVEPVGAAVQVTVTDTGVGIPDGQLARVFDRFWRADPSRTGDGAGLGLAIAKGLVEAQGGRIWADHRPGGGASVSFTLPAATSPLVAA